jgi:hypothetical protein
MRRRLPLFVLIVLGVAGCAGLTEPFGVEDPFAIPKPFQGVERNDDMLKQATEVPAVVVEAPMGLDEIVATALRDRVVVAAQARDVPALAAPTVRAWVLSAQVARIVPSERPVVEQGVISWQLFDDQGTERARFPVTFVGNETRLTDVELGVLAEQTATQLDTALMRPGTQVAQNSATPERAIVWIGAIRGAPGDGNLALARVLAAVLPLKGVRVEAAKAKAQWRIEGQVKIANTSATQDVVTLTWRVFDAKGIEAGKIQQENAVPRGRLNKSWAEIAGFAAEAAAEGIAQLIQQVSAPKPV